MSAYSNNNIVDIKMKQKGSVLSPYNHRVDSSQNHIYQNVDELPLPPPPVGQTGRFCFDGSRSHLQFPLPPLPELANTNKQSQDLSTSGNTKAPNHYENITKMTHAIYDSIYEPIQAKPSCPKWTCSSDSSQAPLYANLIPRTSANNNSANSSTSLGKNFVSKQTPDKSQTAIYANLVNNTPFITSGSHKQSPASIKNYLRVNRFSKEEEEVDHLTDLLVKSMENSAEPDFFGMCNKCGERVVGEGSGCTAMEMVYHIQCFTCFVCHKELRGKPFYAMESNPYCEDCYLNTLEKCCVCEKPILDRILRATGKPYHPSCFMCVVCHKCLDGIPFTVDDSNQIHCIDDFHKKFAPRCSVCKEPIVPEQGKTETVRVVALDRSFHVSCYKCEDCDLLLSSETEGRGCYPLDDHILCRGCNAKRVQAISA